MAADLKARVGLKHGFEIGPVRFVHIIEREEIDGDGLVRKFGKEAFHRGAKFFVVSRGRKVVHDAILVGDGESIEELDEHGILFFDKPKADDVGGGDFERRTGKGSDHGRMSLSARLSLKEDGANFADFSDRIQSRAVKGFVRLKNEGENFAGECRGHKTDEFV